MYCVSSGCWSLRSRCGQVGSFWGLWGKICSIPFPQLFGGLPAISSVSWLLEVSPLSHMAFSLWACLCPNTPFYKDTRMQESLPTLLRYHHVFSSYTYLQTRSHSEVLEARTSTFGFVVGDTIQPQTAPNYLPGFPWVQPLYTHFRHLSRCSL